MKIYDDRCRLLLAKVLFCLCIHIYIYSLLARVLNKSWVMCHNIRAFIEIEGFYANGLVHISQLAKDRVEDVADVVNIGQEVFVKVSG